MHAEIIKALHAVDYYSGLEYGEWSLFNLADLSHYRDLSLPIPSQYTNQPDGHAVWEPESTWRARQPVLDALLAGYDTGRFTRDDAVWATRVLTRYSLVLRTLGLNY